MRRRTDSWPIRLLRWMQPGLVTFGSFWGLNPPFEWFMAGGPHPPGPSTHSPLPPGPGHPERLVPHVPLSLAERALWSQLVDSGTPESGRPIG